MSNSLAKCEICGNLYYRITNSHCETHGLTLLDYQMNFPTAPLISIEQAEEVSILIRDYNRTPEGIETKKRVVETRLKNPNDGFFGSEVISERNRQIWADPVQRRQRSEAISRSKSSPEQRKKISETSRRNWEDPEYIEKVKAGRSGIGFGEASSPNMEELTLECRLNVVTPNCWKYNDTGIRVGKKIPDFIHTSKKKLIEYFGMQWHTRVLGEEEEIVNYYKEQGYDCLVIWGDELFDEKLSERIINFERV